MNFRFMKARYVAPVFFVALAGCSPQFIKKKVTAQRVPARELPTRFEWRSQPDVPKAGFPAIWSLKILDLTTEKDKYKGVRAFEAPHGVAMHLFVVSRDLSRYVHLYPQPRDYGNFLVRPVIPEPGAYQLFVEYLPIGVFSSAPGFPTVKSERFLVDGDRPAPPQKLVPDAPQGGWLTQNVQSRAEESWAPSEGARDYEVKLRALPLAAKQKAALRARVLAGGQLVANLGLHLKGAAYGVSISADGEQFVRLEAKKTATPGEIEFEGIFPASGIYKIWLEFNHENAVVIAPFVVRVKP